MGAVVLLVPPKDRFGLEMRPSGAVQFRQRPGKDPAAALVGRERMGDGRHRHGRIQSTKSAGLPAAMP